MTKDEHIKIHRQLHKNLDELIRDYMYCTECIITNKTIFDLLTWSSEQLKNPTVK